MSNLKRFNKIDNWDILDDYYDKKISGLYFKKSSFIRTFCRCGETYNGIVDKCEKCGNYVFEEDKRDDFNNSFFPFKKNQYIAKNCMEIFNKSISYNESGGLVTLTKKRTDIFRLCKEEVNIWTKYNKDIFTFLKENELDTFIIEHKELFDYEKLIKKYANFLCDKYSLIQKIIISYVLDSKFPIFTNDKDCLKYPFSTKMLVFGFINYLNCSSFNYNSFGRYTIRDIPNDKNFISFVGRDHIKKIDLIESICKYYFNTIDFRDFNFFDMVEIYYNTFRRYNLSAFLKKIEEKKTGFEDILYYYVSNSLMDFDEVINIINKIDTIKDVSLDMKYFDVEWKFCKPSKLTWWESKVCKDNISFRDFFEESYLKFFEIYLKENLINRKLDLIEGFIEQIYDMKQYKIPIKEENFKIKNYNFLLNNVKLSEIYKFPQDRVTLFLDMFETNPLEATNFIKNKKKVTKKEIDDFLKKIK